MALMTEQRILDSTKDLFYISEKDNGIYNAFNKGLSYVDEIITL